MSIVRRPVGFVVTIAERMGSAWGGRRQVVGAHRVARSALYRALLAAQAASLDGVDLDLAWTYPHPQGRGRFAQSVETFASVRQAPPRLH